MLSKSCASLLPSWDSWMGQSKGHPDRGSFYRAPGWVCAGRVWGIPTAPLGVRKGLGGLVFAWRA